MQCASPADDPLTVNFVKVSKSFIFLVKSFLGNFYRHLAIFIWSQCELFTIKEMDIRALVSWLKEETHNLKVVSLNPSTRYWMDILSHIFVVKIVMVLV